MRFMDSISAGQALFVSAITGGPSLIYATATDQWGAVALGSAIGAVGFLWTVRKAGDDQRFAMISARLERSERKSDEYLAEATAAKAEGARLVVEAAALNARLKLSEEK